MEELTEWFLGEFNFMGFMVTSVLVSPTTFMPLRYILYRTTLGRVVKTGVELKTLNIGGGTNNNEKDLVRQKIYDFLEKTNQNFKPKKIITKFIFNKNN